jgi:methanol--5-hydroxybenzimidazolylcobamide Co-methyltransferase
VNGFPSLAIKDPSGLRFGVAPRPVTTRRGLILGGGIVYPELNFTLPVMSLDHTTMPEVRQQYQQMIGGAMQRAVELETPGLVIEFETLPPMTENPGWAVELTRILAAAMETAHSKHGLRSVLRVTPNDTREMERPPRMRSGALYEAMIATFEGCATAGAELLSIESVAARKSTMKR